MRRSALGALLSAMKDGRQDFLETLGLQETLLNVLGHEAVEFLHGNGPPLAANLTLPGLGAASVIPVSPALPGPQRHRAAASGAKTDAGKEGRTADDAGRCHCGATRFEQCLHGLKLGGLDDRRDRHFDHLGLRFALARFPILGVKAVAADIRRSRQHLVNGIDAPPSAVAGSDAGFVQMLGNRFDAHWPGEAGARARQAKDQPHGLGPDGIDLKCLFDAVTALLGGFHDAVSDRRQRAIPEALPRILLHGPQRVLGVLLGLVFVEQRHDLADHVAHRIVAKLLGDRHQPHAALGKPADIELKLELVAEEAAEAVDQDHLERRRFCRRGVDHTLEFRPPIVGRGCAGLDIVGDNLPPTRCAIALRLTALIRNGEIAIGLPSRGDPQVERRPNRCSHGDVPSVLSKQLVEQITEPGFEDIDLRFGHRHVLRPVVRHRPCHRSALSSSSTRARERTRIVVEIVKWGAVQRTP
ncbi:hypothetical protein UP06_23190 [Bradyrhizobium sp. LTSP857]|nr:hypothetical protein UP06_23190 [Bradyrhizobium sp. LTSP857]